MGLKYDTFILQWRKNGLSGLRDINRVHLATAMVRHLDRLAFKAFLEGTWHMFGKQWDKTNFASLNATPDSNGRGADDYDAWTGDEIFLGMHTRDQHGAVDAVGGLGANVVALTTPGTIYSIQRDPAWKSVNQYANPSAALRYEVGAFRNVRYLPNIDQVLWNAGNITMQGVIHEPLYPGSGAARTVDANREVGQENLEYAGQGAKRFIQLDPAMPLADFQQFKVDDYITIHRTRMSNLNPRWSMSGVQDGVDPFEGTNMERRIVSVDEANRRISVDKPILSEYYMLDMGGTVFGYITKGVNIHPTIFLTGPNACVAGVTQSPQTYTPRPFDDFEAYWRVAWDAYLKYQIWNDHAVEVCFNTGPYRFKGLRRY
jgi:hypothetical protein